MKVNTIAISLIAALFFSACNDSGKDGAKSGAKRSANTFNIKFISQPTTLHVLSSTDGYATDVQDYVVDRLGTRNLETYEWDPSLAESWETSADGTLITFKIREGVKWHDGKPLTVEDVKFSFDAVVHPENKYSTAHLKPYFENFGGAKILDGNRVQFTVKKKYFGNFNVLAALQIVPKHLYENPTKEEKKELNKTLVGTGPYIFKEWKRGKYIVLEKNKEWWGNKAYPNKHQIGQVKIRFIKEGNIAIQRLERGDLDFISLRAEEFVKKTNGKKWGKSVQKVKFQNKAPAGYTFIGWNLKNDLFKEREIRVALNHLVDRKKMIDKYDYGLTLPATGPWYQQSEFADPNVKPISFDPDKALALLRKHGWKDTDGDQILDKTINGKKTPFRFTILEPWKEFSKYLVTFQQDAKKVGIDVQIKVVEWNTFVTLLNERKFEAVRLAWGAGSVDLDPKQIWHSSSYNNKGSNFIGYKNPKVDSLIDKARKYVEKAQRIPALQEVYREIAKDAPYVFLFNRDFGFYGHSNKIDKPKDAFNYAVGTSHWTLRQK